MVAVSHVADPAQPVLEIRNLEKRFGLVEVLKSISLEMKDGDFLVLVGPSGCGKSTLLNCIAGLEETSGGQIVIAGRDVTQVPPRDRDIAMVFQSYALYPTMTVAENIGFGMKVRHVPKAEQETKIGEVAKLLQIGHLLGRKPGALSGGQRQRVAMGRALVREPVLFLFDEPLSNLDAKLRVELRGEIKRLHERLGASIVYVTHDQIEAMTLGTRIVVLNHGVIQQIGTPAEIYERPANLFVADFMGSPPMNLIPATHESGRLTFAGGGELAVPAGLRAGAVIVGIRPEAFTPA
ncbi:MAG: ABC transporter ATP-binding protein, partial [Hyphomicrobiales bacterium]